MHAQTDNVAGVKLPKFEQLDSGSGAKMNLTGLGAGGQQVQSTRKVNSVWSHLHGQGFLAVPVEDQARSCDILIDGKHAALMESLPCGQRLKGIVYYN